jgi:hypothetical protein
MPTVAPASDAHALRRIKRAALLPNVEKKLNRVAAALKRANLYHRMEVVNRREDESTIEFTRRYVATFASRRRPVLIVNQGSALDDGRFGNAECVGLPHLKVAIVMRLTGLPHVVGVAEGVSVVCAALSAARVAFVREDVN